jgi:predicted transcriptional regulator
MTKHKIPEIEYLIIDLLDGNPLLRAIEIAEILKKPMFPVSHHLKKMVKIGLLIKNNYKYVLSEKRRQLSIIY